MTTATDRSHHVPPVDQTHTVIRAVEAYLADFLLAQTAEVASLDAALEPLARVASQAALGGGKRLRPVFAYWGWRGAAGGAARPDAIVPALAALEMLHAFALVHDDVMDDSPLRRGRPSAHAALAGEHRPGLRDGAAPRFGYSGAILTGDLCLVWADQLLARTAVPSVTLLHAREVYDRMRVETISGQFLDVLGQASPVWSLGRAEQVVRLKTAAYTVVRPLHFGAALARLDACCAGVDPAGLTDVYTRYGAAVGEAFQLRDDLLDAYGDPSLTGKPAGDDLARARPTVLLELARRLATGAQRAELERAVTAGVHPGRLADMVAETGAAAQVERRISRRTAEALEALAEAPLDPVVRQALADLARAAGERAA